MHPSHTLCSFSFENKVVNNVCNALLGFRWVVERMARISADALGGKRDRWSAYLYVLWVFFSSSLGPLIRGYGMLFNGIYWAPAFEVRSSVAWNGALGNLRISLGILHDRYVV